MAKTPSSPRPMKGTRKTLDKRVTRLQVMLTMDELAVLDNFRFEKRMPSRASAIREILRRGLTSDGFTKANDGSHSKAFGVLKDDSKSNGDGR